MQLKTAAIRLQADGLASYAFVEPERVPELTSALLARRTAACLDAVAAGTTVGKRAYFGQWRTIGGGKIARIICDNATSYRRHNRACP